MAERVFTDAELIAAHADVFIERGVPWPDADRLKHARSLLARGFPACANGAGVPSEAGAIVSAAFLLALGVLPDGWRKNERGSYELIRDGVVWGAVWVNRYTVWFAGDFWPEAVRSGQADIAARLLAAHVELERRRAEGGDE